jgi:hypothetical protein
VSQLPALFLISITRHPLLLARFCIDLGHTPLSFPGWQNVNSFQTWSLLQAAVRIDPDPGSCQVPFRTDFPLCFPELGRMLDFLFAFDNRRNAKMQQLVLAD